MATVNFTGDCGECSTNGSYNSATTPPLGIEVNEPSTVTVNGQPMQTCVIGNCGAYVASVQVEIASILNWQYQILVQGAGPNCWDGGSIYLAFEDQTGDIYYLSIFDSSFSTHSVSYNSNRPNIVAIYWSDYSFTVTTSAVTGAPTPKAKANYRTTSPAK